jgi:DNA polymerase sigma
MRVYVPDKRENTINEILKELYLLRQSVDFQSSTVDSRLAMIDKIRNQLKILLEE